MSLAGFMRIAATALTATSMLATWGGEASPQTRMIRYVVPYPAGSPSDTLARLLADQIANAQGVTMLIENRPGAGGMVGTEAVARAAPDGNTLLAVSPPFVIDPHLRKTDYDPRTNFEPICQLTNAPTVIAVSGASPYRALADLLDAARAKPDTLTIAGVGPGSSVHIAFATLAQDAKVKMTFVPYPGPGPAVNALLGAHVTSVFVPYAAVAGLIEQGTLRALAVSSPGRIATLRDVPAITGSGLRDDDMDIWFGVVAPAKTPPETSSQLAAWFAAALQVPGVRTRLAAQGLYPVGTCGKSFADVIRRTYEDYGRAIRASNIGTE